MPKLIFSLSFLIYFQFTSYAQQGYISGSSSVNLIMPLSIKAGNGDLDFGEIFVTGAQSIEKINPKNGKEFIVIGNPGRHVSVVFGNVELNNYQWASIFGGELSILNFSPQVITQNLSIVTSGENLVLLQNGLIGEVKLFVGGSITIQPNQPIGDYEGLFVLSVSY